MKIADTMLHPIPPQVVVDTVAAFYHVEADDLNDGPKRMGSLAEPWKVAVYLTYRLTRLSNFETAQRFGINHSTVVGHRQSMEKAGEVVKARVGLIERTILEMNA